MPAKPLSPEQKADSERLRAAWEAFKATNPSATQEWLADQCGWKTQAAVNQYLLGKIPLNLPALLKFAAALGVTPPAISPTLSKALGDTGHAPAMQGAPSKGITRLMKALEGLSDDEIVSVAKALEALRSPTVSRAPVMKFKVGAPVSDAKTKR